MSLRILHRWVGVSSAAIALLLAVTGFILSLVPIQEAATTGRLYASNPMSVAQLASAVVAEIPSAERIERTANNTIIVDATADMAQRRYTFDPASMSTAEFPQSSGFISVVKTIHRSLYSGDMGRGLAGICAAAILALTVSGGAMMVSRMGGWRALIHPPKSGGAQRIHMDAIRLSLPGLLIAALTGVYMSLATFGIIPDGSGFGPDFADVPGLPSLPLSEMAALKAVDLSSLREIMLPMPDFPGDVITLTTDIGTDIIDPASGEVVSSEPHSMIARVYEIIYMLHTGQGAWFFGLFFGLSVLAAPFAIVSGVWMVACRPKSAPKRPQSAPAEDADSIILVGSEGETTWGFAAELAHQLIEAGHRIHLAPMNSVTRVLDKRFVIGIGHRSC